MTQLNIDTSAQTDVNAIANLLNQTLQAQGIATKAVLKGVCLQIMLESAQVPDEQVVVPLIRARLVDLGIQSSKKVKIYGRQIGEDFPDWQHEFDLEEQVNLSLSTLETDRVAQPIASIEIAADNELSLQKQPNRLELAKQGDSQAINDVLNYLLQAQGMLAKANLKDGYLQITLQADTTPEQEKSVAYIRKFITQLELGFLKKVKVCGRRKGATFLAWNYEFELQKSQAEQPSIWGSMFGAVAGAAGAIGGATVQASQAVVGTAIGVGGAIGGAVAGTAGAIGGATVQASQAVVGTAVGVGGAITSTALQTPEGLGHLLGLVGDSPQLQQLTKAVQVDWLFKIIDQVDIVKAETHVRRLQQKYPHEQPSAIAHRLMAEKSMYVGGSGLASSLLPGFAAGLVAVDLAATTAIQAEMIYQIACTYGLDLQEPARKGEVIAIFGLAFGGGCAIKAGLGFLRNIPVAGAVIGASTNAVTLYALGYAACRFYEAKINPLTSQVTLAAAQAESEKYLEVAIAQEVVMDRILVHVVLAGNPGKTWEQILPELQSLNLSPASLEVIAANIKSPPSLDTLLSQVNHDFAIPLLAQCEKIAQLDGRTTPEEAKVIETITRKFGININSLKQKSV